MAESFEVIGIYHRLGQQEQFMVDMWRGVVSQAIRDMDLHGRRTRDEAVVRIELEALSWLGGEDYRQCCALALVDADELLIKLKEILAFRPPYRRLLLRDLADLLRDPPPKPEPEELSLDGDFDGLDGPEFDPL